MLAKVRRTPLKPTNHDVNRARSILVDFDSKHGTTEHAHEIAAKHGHLTKHTLDNAGRTLWHYAPIHAHFTRFVGSPTNRRVLHLGASTGLYTHFLQEQGALAVPLDIEPAFLEAAKTIGNKLPVRATAKLLSNNPPMHLPFADKSFDVFISDHFMYAEYGFLEHHPSHPPKMGNTLPQSSKLLEELHRVLRNRGIGIMHRVMSGDVDAATEKARLLGFAILESKQLPQDGSLSDLVIQKLSTPKPKRGKGEWKKKFKPSS